MPVDDVETGEADVDNTEAEDSSVDDDNGAEGDDGSIVFDSRDSFVKAVNKIVKQRLDRNNKKYAPVVQERDTLKAKVDEWAPLIEGKQTDDQKREASERQLRDQVNELLGYKRTTERNELVRRVARDKGLPEEFISRIQGDDEDSITADVESFVALLPEKGVGTKVSKTTKPASKDEGKGGGKGSVGGSGSDSDESIDPRKLAASIGRYGRNPYIVG